MSKFLLLLLVAFLPAFVFAQAPPPGTAVVSGGLSAMEENAISAAASTDWEPGPSVIIGRTRWTCRLLHATADSGNVSGGGQLGVCTARTTGINPLIPHK